MIQAKAAKTNYFHVSDVIASCDSLRVARVTRPALPDSWEHVSGDGGEGVGVGGGGGGGGEKVGGGGGNRFISVYAVLTEGALQTAQFHQFVQRKHEEAATSSRKAHTASTARKTASLW